MLTYRRSAASGACQSRFAQYIEPKVDQEGRLVGTQQPDYVIATIGSEVWRIRECPICQKLFWAGRSDKRTCSVVCGNTHRQREWRCWYSENSGEYKEQRYKSAELNAKKGGKA